MAQLRRDDSDRFFDYDIHVPSRTIFMGGECNEGMAERFLKGMRLLDPHSQQGITVIMNNTGGDEYHGLAIYDAIATATAHVTIIAYGHAMSMGSWIPQAADARIMAPNATMMLHYGSWGGYELESIHVNTMARENKRLTKLMEAEYLRRIREVQPKFPTSRLRKMLTEEIYLTAHEAVELGLADSVLGEEEE